MKKGKRLKYRFKKLLVISCLLLALPMVSNVFFTVFAEPLNYIYFDLNCGSVTINSGSYSGCVYRTADGETTSVTVSGKHNSSNAYYVYQSNDSNKSITGYIGDSDKIVLPVYASLDDTIQSFVNYTDVEGAITKWDTDAIAGGRGSTGNWVSITGNSTFDVTVDNIWSKHQSNNTSRKDGGIAFYPNSTGAAYTTIRFKGENRIGNLFYQNNSSNVFLELTSIDGAGETNGALVVANVSNNSAYNHYNSGIGASDTGDHSVGLKITGGTIYVGTNKKDDCTAIGGGGNGKGHVTISGGIITAVSNSTGTAIGGGIGESSYGGDANVSITGGTIYAYNMGYVFQSNGTFIPGAAIGGGSSRLSTGNKNTTVSITGGTVYAQSVGGVAIGGGNSASLAGGPATVSIGGNANVVAESVAGSYVYKNATYNIAPGSGIGGGTGGTKGSGGTATVIISGGKVNSGTIGGGETNGDPSTYSVGDANVTITGGEVTGRILMYNGSFEMKDGILKGGTSENGGCVQMYNGTATISGGEIKDCVATNNGGGIYLGGGTFYSKGGKIHQNAAQNGSGIYIEDGTVEMSAGNISQNESTLNGGGIYLGGGIFYSRGGIIHENVAQSGSGIYIEDGVVEMSAGDISDNESTLNGAGIYIGGNGTIQISGGSVKNNVSSAGEGGGIYLSGGSITMTNGLIEMNQSKLNGGGVSIGGNGTFDMFGGNLIKNSSLLGNGGGVYLSEGTINMEDGKVNENDAKLNGGGIAIGGVGEFNISGGEISKNKSLTGNGGGIFVANGSVTIHDGKITENETLDANGGLGGGICVSSGNIMMHDGNIESNRAVNGGGFYLTNGSFEIQNGSIITKNTAQNGAGGYVLNGLFNLTGGTTSYNTATNNGGGYYIVNASTVNLSNGIISNNSAKNGGGFYQTQNDGHITVTTLAGTCYVNNNNAVNGNGGGIYVDGGSTFRIINGKVIYNGATGVPSESDLKSNYYDRNGNVIKQTVYAKDSSSGVGGGVYIKNGTFTMKNHDGTNGTSAIFGNTATYAADDLFSYGNNLTVFDAIPVTTMEKDDAYVNSTDWFEDYPEGERHISLKISDNGSFVNSKGRYKKTTSEADLVKADSVLTTSYDYICITMGANVGTLTLRVNDGNVGSDATFVYVLRNDINDVTIRLSVKQGEDIQINDVPVGRYVLTKDDLWSWRYAEGFSAEIITASETVTKNNDNNIDINVVGGHYVVINTKYNMINKSVLSRTLYTGVPLPLSGHVVE